METVNISLSPQNLSNPDTSLFRLPSVVWSNLYNTMSGIALMKSATLDSVNEGLIQIGYPNLNIDVLQSCADTWCGTDIPNLKAMALELATIGNVTIPASIEKLQAQSPAFKNGKYSDGDVAAFTEILSALHDSISTATLKGQLVNIDLKAIDSYMSNSDKYVKAAEWNQNQVLPNSMKLSELSQENPDAQALWNDMEAFKVFFNKEWTNTVLKNVAFVNGSLGTLLSEISNAIDAINKISFNKNPFEVTDDFNVALIDWKTVATDAYNFSGIIG